MPIFETYASRVAAAARTGAPEIYTYDDLPPLLRRQITKIVIECIGPGSPKWDEIASVMDREVSSYAADPGLCAYENCLRYLTCSENVEGVLSLVEFCGQTIAASIMNENAWQGHESATVRPSEGLVELNERFLGAGVGYQFENGRIIRIDSQYTHAEIVKEVLRLLCEPGFEETNAEFMTAHRHLREGKLRDCNTAALRAMEAALKVICDARGWTYQKSDTVERLLAVAQREGLFPEYLGGYFNNLIGAMKAGIPKIRDQQGGHGAAPCDGPVPDHIAAFALHLTASNIVMLVKAHRSLPMP
jgi:hypothetical protein